MPLPPEQEQQQTALPRTLNLKGPAEWVCLLLAGVFCIYVSGGDLSRVGDQLIGAGLTAFKMVLDKRSVNQ
jgi:hypothetical protein